MTLIYEELPGGTLVEQVTYALERAILDGELAPGADLRQENLCATLGISRTPVREALRRLQADGLVELRANRTARVRRMARPDVLDLYEVRAQLEGWACERAATRLTQADMAELEDAQAALERAAAEVAASLDADVLEQADLHERLREANHRFHSVIHRASDSPLLAELITRACARFPKDYVWRALSRREDSLVLNTEQHRQIMAAFAAQAPAAAAEAMQDHVMKSGELLIGHLDRNGFWAGEAASAADDHSRVGGNRRV